MATHRGLAAAAAMMLTTHCTLSKSNDGNQPAPTDQRSGNSTNAEAPGAPGTPAAPGTASAPGHLSEADFKATTDIVGYAKYCKQELGLPQDVLPPWNCLAGKEIPTTVEGRPLDGATYDKLKNHTVGCDLGSWLGDEPCANYGFVQQRQVTADVSATLLCRKRTFDTWKDRATRQADLRTSLTDLTFDTLYAFDSLGLIWTNTKTGKTCYFDFVGKVYGGYVASPDDERFPELTDLPSPPPADYGPGTPAVDLVWHKNGRTTWRTPQDVAQQDNCIRCHDTGALKGSPWMMQVFNVPINDPSVPFEVVGSLFDRWRQTLPIRAISTAPIRRNDGTEEPQACTQCHRIGSQATCDTFLNFSVGTSQPGTMSNLAKTFFYRVWMPPSAAAAHGRAEGELTAQWSATYDKHVNRLKCCCANPQARGCLSQDITARPLAAPEPGPGPAVCP